MVWNVTGTASASSQSRSSGYQQTEVTHGIGNMCTSSRDFPLLSKLQVRPLPSPCLAFLSPTYTPLSGVETGAGLLKINTFNNKKPNQGTPKPSNTHQSTQTSLFSMYRRLTCRRQSPIDSDDSNGIHIYQHVSATRMAAKSTAQASQPGKYNTRQFHLPHTDLTRLRHQTLTPHSASTKLLQSHNQTSTNPKRHMPWQKRPQQDVKTANTQP